MFVRCLEYNRPTRRAPDPSTRLRQSGQAAGDCPEGVRTSQAVFHALAFSQSDGFAVPALVVKLAKTQRR